MPPQLRQAALRYAAEALAALGRPAEAARHLVAVLEGAAGGGEAEAVRAAHGLRCLVGDVWCLVGVVALISAFRATG